VRRSRAAGPACAAGPAGTALTVACGGRRGAGRNGAWARRDLITAVRKAKTAAEEREIVKKESAFLRNAFGSKGDKFKARNLVKLMYIHMLGYPTQFGQLECLKLITQGTYAEKVR